MKKEDILKIRDYVFNSSEEKEIVLYRGCIERGYTQEIYHCGNEECSSCNMVKEEMNRWSPHINLDFKENENTKLWSELRNSAKNLKKNRKV